MTTYFGVALVTGASSGIGKTTAIALKSTGFTTYATDRNPQTLSDLEAKGCHVLQLDITKGLQIVQTTYTSAIKSYESFCHRWFWICGSSHDRDAARSRC